MNDNESLPDRDEQALLAQLRALPRQLEPPPGLWGRIEAQLPQQAAEQVAVAAVPPARRPRRWRWAGGLALAASVTLVAVMLLPRLRAPEPAATPAAPPLVAEADALAGQYRVAISALPVTQVPVELRPALHELDHSADSIRAAIRQSPDADFLLDQLQRTYAKRLELTRMAAFGVLSSTT